MKEIKVKINETLHNGYQVKINGLLIVQYATRDEAEHLVNHFIEINPKKNIVFIEYE